MNRNKYLCGLTSPGSTLLCGLTRVKNEEWEFAEEIRAQFVDQLKCIEARSETQCALLAELHEYYKRRADVHNDHAKQLDKLAKNIANKNRANEQKRDAWTQHSVHSMWSELVDHTRVEARHAAVLADLYSAHVCTAIQARSEHLHRISKRCREVMCTAHDEISRVLNELQTALKTYQLSYTNCSVVESKFRVAESARIKFEETHPTKVPKSRKFKAIDREYQKKREKFLSFQVSAIKARNEYLLCVDAANAALHQYYANDISDVLDCTDLGLQNWLSHLSNTVVAARKAVCQGEMDSLADLSCLRENFDTRMDKQRFIEANHSTFMLPRRFEFRPHLDDEIRHVADCRALHDELMQRHYQIEKRLHDLCTDHEEIWKTLTTAERRVLELQTQPAIDVEALVGQQPTASGSTHTANTSGSGGNTDGRPSCREPDTAVIKRRQDLTELEDYYIEKFHQYLLTSNLIKRLQARADAIRGALEGPQSECGESKEPSPMIEIHGDTNDLRSDVPTTTNGTASQCSPVSTATNSTQQQQQQQRAVNYKPRKRIGYTPTRHGKRPRLFGGSLEEYIEATGEQIPLVIVSCIRVLQTYALHHQGVFRVSGSQLEINTFKDAFERGEDPLINADNSHVNSVAGLLKLYLRELREPMFPVYMFNQFTDCAKLSDRSAFLQEICTLISSLHAAVVVVLRYLFAFLNHLSEFSDENMMDPYNLAICFGPTLLPIPDGKDQVFYHNYVNELVKNMIVHCDRIFPWHLPGPVYEKFRVDELEVDASDEIMLVDEHPAKHSDCKTTMDGNDSVDSPSTPDARLLLTDSVCLLDDDEKGMLQGVDCEDDYELTRQVLAEMDRHMASTDSSGIESSAQSNANDLQQAPPASPITVHHMTSSTDSHHQHRHSSMISHDNNGYDMQQHKQQQYKSAEQHQMDYGIRVNHMSGHQRVPVVTAIQQTHIDERKRLRSSSPSQLRHSGDSSPAVQSVDSTYAVYDCRTAVYARENAIDGELREPPPMPVITPVRPTSLTPVNPEHRMTVSSQQSVTTSHQHSSSSVTDQVYSLRRLSAPSLRQDLAISSVNHDHQAIDLIVETTDPATQLTYSKPVPNKSHSPASPLIGYSVRRYTDVDDSDSQQPNDNQSTTNTDTSNRQSTTSISKMSPNSLLEIQSELKSVLHSLEQFTVGSGGHNNEKSTPLLPNGITHDEDGSNKQDAQQNTNLLSLNTSDDMDTESGVSSGVSPSMLGISHSTSGQPNNSSDQENTTHPNNNSNQPDSAQKQRPPAVLPKPKLNVLRSKPIENYYSIKEVGSNAPTTVNQ